MNLKMVLAPLNIIKQMNLEKATLKIQSKYLYEGLHFKNARGMAVVILAIVYRKEF